MNKNDKKPLRDGEEEGLDAGPEAQHSDPLIDVARQRKLLALLPHARKTEAPCAFFVFPSVFPLVLISV